MNDELFEALVSAYGANMNRWPEEHRAAGAEFSAKNPRAQALLAAAGKLDGLLSAMPAPKASDALRARILASTVHPDTFIVWFGREMRRYAALFLFMAAAGAWAGSSAVGGELLQGHSSDPLSGISALSE